MRKKTIYELLNERILVLDGGLGTMIQGRQLTEADYRGTRFADHATPLKGHLDLLNVTRPDVVCAIQRMYLEAGADIFVTNTFNANAISMADYGTQHLVREVNLTAGLLSRKLADDFMREHPKRTVFVGGSIGPTNKTASMSPDVNDPALRTVSYMDLYHAYYEQIDALVDGGVDIVFFETAFDTLNVKAGLNAAVQVIQDKNRELPVILSLTLSGKSGRTFSGQTLDAFLASVQHIPLTCIGLNCSFGASEMKPFLQALSQKAPYYICAYPNAGLPNQFGQYVETPESMAAKMKAFVDEGLVNIIGGCCGTTPAHIALFPALVDGIKPRKPAKKPTDLWLSGLDLLEVKPENNFINIGERCNVAGSRLFLRLIKEKKYDEALKIARKQVEDGAQIIDINMDDGMLDAQLEMTTFLRLIASDPDVARVPVMIDSSSWEVIEQGLMCVQGKCIVNSISLKAGEDIFINQAKFFQKLGGAAIVMAFDEKGQADSFERKIEVCVRAYKVLTEKAGFPPQDIIFDPNVLAIATGVAEHNRYALDFIRAVGWIKKNLPFAKVSGGVSNLSFSFRGNNEVREAMHAVFLYHAIREGMDMGIVNPSTSVLYNDIEPTLRDLLEDVILARRPEAADELIAYTQEHSEQKTGKQEKTPHDQWRQLALEARIDYALMKGVSDYLHADLNEALQLYEKPVDIINGPLMNAMNRVGELFGAGKMFLPQIIKTARTMKRAVELLQPSIETGKTGSAISKAGKIVFATVKGDVHDIGKNIVSIVLACNNYEVIDLGIMTPAETILKAIQEHQPDFLCLSGLITPSLEEMAHVAREMQKAGMTIPIMIGGATTSKVHTAIKLAPLYDYPIIHAADASQNPVIAAKLLDPETRQRFINELNEEYELLRKPSSTALFPLDEARRRRFQKTFKTPIPKQTGIHRINIPIADVLPYINWKYFFTAWKLNGRFASIAQIHDCEGCRAAWLHEQPEPQKAREALKLYDDAKSVLCKIMAKHNDEDTRHCESNYKQRNLDCFVVPPRNDATDSRHCEPAKQSSSKQPTPAYCEALYGFFPAVSDGDNIHIEHVTIPMLRQQTGNCLSLADYIAPESDYIGLFAVTAGKIAETQQVGDDYERMLIQTLSDRLVEAASEYLHEKVRKDYWGYAPDENISIEELFKAHYQGIRPAVGFPSLPDQGLMFKVGQILPLAETGINLTENGALTPSSSVAGFYFAHPESTCFMVGKISEDQLQDYAARRETPADMLRKFLSKNLV